MIETGSQAPDFSLETSDGVVSFSDFKGHKNVMLIFYPLDWTGTWSKEIPDLEANLGLFEDLDTQVLGVSIDTKHSHKNWAVSLGGVNFPLLSDWHPKGQMAKRYGVYSEEKGYSIRSTVIIDKQGIVRYSEAVEPGGRRYANELAEICSQVLWETM